ncbi:unnamed protein product [Paramecium sonneborni]|uniref:Uncharacterized protein n=1 Tax=Paramecium sonneborni TaxID=65129 RepID=A0A8S1PY38_9CILI|nr:unnamed protein product [Paramecium sonneborni]
MAYQIDFSKLKLITDDTPQLKREPPAIFAKKESTDYFDANSTICECNDDIQPYSFQLRFKLELKQQPISQNQDDKEFCNMGSSFGVNENDNQENQQNHQERQSDTIHINNCIESNHNQSPGNVKSHFNQIQKRNVSVQTNKLFLKHFLAQNRNKLQKNSLAKRKTNIIQSTYYYF